MSPIMKQQYINNDEITSYLKDLRKIPVITHKRQDEICLLLQNPNITENERTNLLNELVVGNLRFVIKIARGYLNRGLELPDLINEGNMGLIRASEKFDPTNGVRFFSYAVWWVKLFITNSIHYNGKTIRIPTKVIEQAQKNTITYDTKDWIIVSRDSTITLPHTVRLNSKLNDDNSELIDIINNENADVPDDIFNNNDDLKEQIRYILKILEPRERTIIEKSFGLNGVEVELEELGVEFNCTKERIRQLRDIAIRKLRNESHLLFNY